MKSRIFKILFILTALFLFSCSASKNSTSNSESTNKVNSNAKIDDNPFIHKDFGSDIKDIVIFSTNDSLSEFNSNLGISSIKYFIDHFDRNENYATLVDIGNFSAGTYEAEISKGKSSIEIMNEVGYDIVVPGSYEFKYGLDTFFENMKMLNADVVCCNIYNIKERSYPFEPYVIYKYGDLNIGFVGVTSPEALFIQDNYEYFFDEDGNQILYLFEDEDGTALYKQVQDAVDAAKYDGADKVILLAHLGIEGITDRWTSTSVIANTKDIDALIDGHSMEVLDSGLMVNKVGSFIPMVQAGSKLQYLGAMNITNEDYIYPAVMKDRSVNTKDIEFQKVVDKILDKYK